MNLRVIEGGQAAGHRKTSLTIAATLPSAADVQAEARRRITASGHDSFAAREIATGIRVPAAVRHLRLQITFAATALASLDPIPPDFAADFYWPQ